MRVKKHKEAGKEDIVISIKCKKIVKRGGFSERRFTKLSQDGQGMDKCKPDEFLCGLYGKYDEGGKHRWIGHQCCYGDNIEVSEKETTEETEITETSKELRATKETDAVCTNFEMM